MQLNPNSSLLVIDVQNDFCPGGALAVSEGNLIVNLINEIALMFQTTILTQDWHPTQHSSFASSHEGKEPFEQVEMAYGLQVLWPDHCVQGSTGADFHADLKTNCADLILRKGFRRQIDSYSAFFENDHTTATGLDGYLKSRGINNIFCVGLATDFCVYYSAIDAIKLGYGVTVLEDACRAIDLAGSLASARADMLTNGVELSNTLSIQTS